MHSKENHEILKRAMEIWQEHTHSHYTDVTLRQFVGVFHATMQAVRERKATEQLHRQQ